MATQSPSSRTKPVTRTVSILSKRKSLWKMVRSMLLPARLVSTFASCGGGGAAAKRRRRLERAKRVGQAPIERRRIPTTTSMTTPTPTTIEESSTANIVDDANLASVTRILQEITLAENVPAEPDSLSHHPVLIHQVQIDTNVEADNQTNEEPQNLQDPTPPETTPTSTDETTLSEEIIVRRRDKSDTSRCTSSSIDAAEFHGWRKSSIDVNTEPPLTLKWIPSGLQIGDQVLWLSEEAQPPEKGVVQWIGKIRSQFYAGVQFERSIGNSSGLYGYGGGLVARLFTCDLGFGRFVPIDELVLYSDFHDKGIKAGFICIICRDDFLELPDAQGEDGHMVSTKCGHLYHGTCLQGWLAAKAANNKAKKGEQNQPCPHCQSPINVEDIIRLFPAQV